MILRTLNYPLENQETGRLYLPKIVMEDSPEPLNRFMKEFDDKPLKAIDSDGYSNDLKNEVFASKANSFMEPQVRLLSNPVNNDLELNITEGASECYKIEIYDIKGLRIYSENFSDNLQSQLYIDLGRLNMQSGLYILRYSDQSGVCKNIKFIKKSF